MPRRKIEIKKIEDRAKLYTTFTKRRKGLFNKASEYCKLFNAEAAMLVYSNSGNLFMWGHPNEEKVINDYLRSSSILMDQDDEDAAGPSSSSSSDQTERGDEAQEEEQASGSAQEEEEESQEGTESAEIDENLKEIKDWLQVVKDKKKERKAISVFRGNAESEFFLRL